MEALRGLELGGLWDELGRCMAAVASLEGLTDTVPQEAAAAAAAAAPMAAVDEAAAAPVAPVVERRPAASLTASSSLAGLLAR